jgi:amino acid transporter
MTVWRGRRESTPPDRIVDRRVRRESGDDRYKLTAPGGVAALSLDALSSVAYGPQAIVTTLVAAGAGAVGYTLPVTVGITVLLLFLVVSYRQVIAAYPNGGGAYAVAKKDLGAGVSLLAAASLVVDYVLTVAVSLAAGAASLASVFPPLAHDMLGISLIGLLVLTGLNLVGIAESAKALALPAAVFIASILGLIVVGLIRSHPVATIGQDSGPQNAAEAIGIILILKAFAAGCSALTGVEAIANGVPAFRTPAVKRAQHTELALGVLLGTMLLGLGLLIKIHHVTPRGGVTVLAQLSAAAFGTGWLFYVTNIAVTLVLGLAANTSFGGLPVLMSLLAKDNRLPHVFALRAERPVFRWGVSALAILAAILLIATNADTIRLLPLFAIGVFIGFTISQTGMVRHWHSQRSPGWLRRAVLNATGAVLTAGAAIVFMASKFLQGAWLLLIIIPALIWLYRRIEHYYRDVARQLGLGQLPAMPTPPTTGERNDALVIVPVVDVSHLTELALRTAYLLGGEVVPVAVQLEHATMARVCEQWRRWNPGVELHVLPSPHRSLVTPIVGYVRTQLETRQQVTVLIAQVQPRHRRFEMLHNQRDLVLEAALRSRTTAVVATVAFRLK